MAATLRSGMARAHLLQLHSTIRSFIYTPAVSRRTFSSTPPRQTVLTDVVIAGPSAILDAIHGFGVSWYAAIPVTAVLVRGTIGYYLGALPSRKKAIVRTYLAPLVYLRAREKTSQHLTKSRAAAERKGRKIHSTVVQLEARAFQMLLTLTESHRLGKKFNAPLLRTGVFLNLGLLLAFAEAIRVKCGHKEGMLSMLLNPIEELLKLGPDTGKDAEPKLSNEEMIAQRMEEAQAAADVQADLYTSGTGDVMVDPKLLDPAYHYELLSQAATKTYADNLDPSMIIEGLSWAPNLALPDPTWGLPAILGATIALGAYRPNRTSHTMERPKKREIEIQVQGEPAPPKVIRSTHITAANFPEKAVELDPELVARSEQINAAFALADKLRDENRAAKQKGTILKNHTLGQKIRLFMAGLFFYVGTGLPSGILLYLIPSVLMGWLQGRWLDAKHPLPVTVTPCKRPMRMKVRKEFGNA